MSDLLGKMMRRGNPQTDDVEPEDVDEDQNIDGAARSDPPRRPVRLDDVLRQPWEFEGSE